MEPNSKSGESLMGDNKNKSIVRYSCDAHAISCYDMAVVDELDEGEEMWSTSPIRNLADMYSEDNEGRDEASLVGCNANNANAGRSCNANNALRNGNDNYAGGFAPIWEREEPPTSWSSRPNKKDERIGTVGYVQPEYESLPFMGCDIAEKDAKNTDQAIWLQLAEANKKRNLKGLRKFYLNKEIVMFAIKRATKSLDTKPKRHYHEHAEYYADKIIEDLKNDTYYVHGYMEKDLDKRFKSSKTRHAKIYTLYDRCVQMLCLIIIEQKFRNKVLRNNYSNIEGRGILCNDKTYGMLNNIRHASGVYQDQWILTTDIKKFYENVKWKKVIEILFRTVKDKITRDILYKTFEASCDLPIGCCLSPLVADILMNDYDEIILRDYKPRFFAAFGDNRLFIGRKDILQKILSFSEKYYTNHYHFKMKGDHTLGQVSNGFWFCKTWYYRGYVRIRGELKRRAIKAAFNPQSFAGYQGILQKTDSKHLLNEIKTNLFKLRSKNRFIMAEENIKKNNIQQMDKKTNTNNTKANVPFRGRTVKFSELINKVVAIVAYKKIMNNKDSQYYIQFQMIVKDAAGKPELVKAHSGCYEIKEAYEIWVEKNVKLPLNVTICSESDRSYYFKEFHKTAQELCDEYLKDFDINLDELT